MIYIHLFMVIGGIVLIATGLWAVHCREGFLEKLGAFLAPIGLIIAILGVLLLCVPDFFP